jgi:hypothetical protein
MAKKEITELKGKKKAMMDALVTTMGNITAASKKVGISRFSHYEWLESDPIYAKHYEAIDDMEVDFYRTALQKLVQEGNVTAAIFGLKTKGKKRGYIERQEIEQTGTVHNKLQIEVTRVEKREELPDE